MTIRQLHALLRRVFPQVNDQFRVLALRDDGLSLRMLIDESHLRPGGTVSGPAMFALADCAFYLATLAMIGPEALAVTTSCSIDFMRKPAPRDLIGEARILKLGRTLSVGDVLIHAIDDDRPVARAIVTYSIPPGGQGVG
ncbi:MAG: PaaI family thioesterase [Paracoccaceae bacterium]